MNKLALFFFCSCATTTVPLPYTTEHAIFARDFRPSGSSTKTVTVHNPYTFDIIATVKCQGNLLESDDGNFIHVPANGMKQFLADVPVRYNDACYVVNFDFVGEE